MNGMVERMNNVILEGIGDSIGCRSSDILRHLNSLGIKINRSTLTRYLSKMELEDRIVVDGKGAGRRYSVNDIGLRLANQNRPIVPFSMDRLTYTPFFNDDQLSEIDSERVTDVGDTYASDIMEAMVIDLSFGSSSLEGNTYSLLDTQALIEYGEESSSADRQDTIMILNHKNAIKHAISTPSVTFFELRQIHSKLMESLIHPRDCGLIRSDRVNIHGSKYSPPIGRELITEAIEKIMSELGRINHPAEKAMYLMAAIPYVQPYADGNKRTGRLVMNIPLIHSGYPPMSFKNVDKSEYIKGMVSFYEFGYKKTISTVFLNAYKGAGQEYTSRYSYEQNPEAIAYRNQIKATVHHVISKGTDLQLAMELHGIPERLTGLLEVEVESVHEGNCSLYGLEDYFNSDTGMDI